jgi:16S rRNA (adenine1518-N6/adenine1519-N6)-dimethyltransferase
MPRPKVDSAVISFDILKSPRIDVVDEKMLFRVIRGSFGQRRKTLLNSLSNNLEISKDIIKEVLEKSGIDPQVRGETLSLSQFGRISDEISKIKQLYI